MFAGGAADDATRRQLAVPRATSPRPVRRHRRASGSLGLHRAFPAGPDGGTRLVLTQSTYQLQRWLDWLDAHPARHRRSATARAASPAQSREAFAQRGPWARIARRGGADAAADARATPTPSDPFEPLRAAFDHGTADDRWRQSRAARLRLPQPTPRCSWRTPARAWSSAARRRRTPRSSGRSRSRRTGRPCTSSSGKLWLRADDTERAAAAFAEAARLMPSLRRGLQQPGRGARRARTARRSARRRSSRPLRFDPFGHPILNNIGACLRDLGRLDEAEASFRQVDRARARSSSSAHYNLGHALLPAGTLRRRARRLRGGAGAPTRSRARGSAAARRWRTPRRGDPRARGGVLRAGARRERAAETRAELVNESAARAARRSRRCRARTRRGLTSLDRTAGATSRGAVGRRQAA